MTENYLVLLVSEQPASAASVREALTSGEAPIRMQWMERLRTALARIGGGGIDLLLLEISGGTHQDLEKAGREALAALRAGAPDIPVVLLCQPEEEAQVRDLAREAALSYSCGPNWQRDLASLVRSEIERYQSESRSTGRQSHGPAGQAQGPARQALGSEARGSGTVITFLGAKGGVGASTVALNVASLLAQNARVILAEVRSSFGMLCHFFRPHRTARNLGTLLPMTASAIDSAQVEACLWPNRGIPGMSILFAPDKLADQLEVDPLLADKLLVELKELADFIVVDIPASLSETNRAIVKRSDTLALVTERDALSVELAKMKLAVLEESGIGTNQAGSVVVNRVPFAAPVPLPDIETKLGLPIFAVVPPAADLCASAFRAHTPLVKLDPQSLIGQSYANLVHSLGGRN